MLAALRPKLGQVGGGAPLEQAGLLRAGDLERIPQALLDLVRGSAFQGEQPSLQAEQLCRVVVLTVVLPMSVRGTQVAARRIGLAHAQIALRQVGEHSARVGARTRREQITQAFFL
jgi:hypothetical protein